MKKKMVESLKHDEKETKVSLTLHKLISRGKRALEELFFWKDISDPEFIKNQIPQIEKKFAQLPLEDQFYIWMLLGMYVEDFFYDKGFIECVEQVSPDLVQLFDHPVFKVDDYHRERMETYWTLNAKLKQAKQASGLSPEQLEEMDTRIWKIVMNQTYGDSIRLWASLSQYFDSLERAKS